MSSPLDYAFRIPERTESRSSEKRDIIHYASYAVFFSLTFSICNLIERPQIASYVIVAINLVCYVTKRMPKLAFASSFVLGNELACFLNLIIGLFAMGRGRRGLCREKPTRFFFIVCSLLFALLAVTVVNTLALGTFVNSITSIIYFAFLSILFYRMRGLFGIAELRRVVVVLSYAEAIIVFVTCLAHGFEPSDSNYGSLGNAHFLGIWCCMSMLILYACRTPRSRKRNFEKDLLDALPYFALVITLFFTDTKAPVLCGIAAMGLYVLIWGMFKSQTVIPAFISFVAAFMVVVVCLGIPAVEKVLTKNDGQSADFFSQYVYSEETSLKYDYFYDTVQALISSEKMFAGYGMGQYGSRFANLYGYSFAYREDNAVNRVVAAFFDSRMLEEYKKHASRYDDVLVANIGGFSAISVYPFSSFMALLAEGGLIGVVLLCFVFRAMRPNQDAQLLLMFFLGCCVMDIYIDHIQLVGYLLFALSSLRMAERNPAYVFK